MVLASPMAAVKLAAAAAGMCDLSGKWRAVSGDHGRYACAQTGQNLVFTYSSGGAAQHWQNTTGTITSANAVTLTTDTHNTLVGAADKNCSYLSGAKFRTPWCRVGSKDCGRAPPPRPPPPAPSVDPSIKHVHVVAMNHLDIGFSCPGCGGSSNNRTKLASGPAPYTW